MKPIVTRYPHSIEQFRTFITPHMALKKMTMAYPSLQNPYYMITRRAARKIKFKCAKCNAYMMYEQNEEKVYTYQEGDLEHSHPIAYTMSTRRELTKTSKEFPSLDKYIMYTMESLYVTVQMTNNYRRYFRCTYVSVIKLRDFHMLIISSSTHNREVALFAIALLPRIDKPRARSLIQ